MAAMEIVDLLSSPEPEPKPKRLPKKAATEKPKTLFFGSDDFGNEDSVTPLKSLPPPSLSPQKRRSPSTEVSRAKRVKAPVLMIDDDSPPRPVSKAAANSKENTPPRRKPREEDIIRLSPSPIRDLPSKPRQKKTVTSFDSDSDDIPPFQAILNKAKSDPQSKRTSAASKTALSESTKRLLASLDANDDSDPIISSSQPSPLKPQKKQASINNVITKPTSKLRKSGDSGSGISSWRSEKPSGSRYDDFDPIESSQIAPPTPKKKGPSIDNIISKPVSKARKSGGAATESRERSESPLPSSQPKPRKSRLTEEEKARRAEEKALKDEEKRREKLLKDAEKEVKAREKANENRITAANKNKIKNVEDSLQEMIVDIPESLMEETTGVHLEAKLKEVEEKHKEKSCNWTLNRPAPVSLPVGHIISWRRKVASEYDYEQEQFVPFEKDVIVIRKERHILCVLTAVEYLELTVCNMNGGLRSHIRGLVSSHPEGGIPIYLIEGMHDLCNKMRAKEQREWRKHALGEDRPASSQARKSKDEKKAREQTILEKVTPDQAEEALLDLQFTSGCKVLMHETKDPIETAEWIFVFTKEVGRGYYKSIEATSSHHGIERTNTCGVDLEDTFYKMLQEISRVTPSIANGIMSKACNVRELVELCRKEGKDFAADIKNRANKNGAPSERRIGPACSARIYTAFTSMDPTTENV